MKKCGQMNEIIINCSIASQKKMYGQRKGQTQVKFKFECDKPEIQRTIDEGILIRRIKTYYINEQPHMTYATMLSYIMCRCEELTERFEHNNWKFVWNPPKELM